MNNLKNTYVNITPRSAYEVLESICKADGVESVLAALAEIVDSQSETKVLKIVRGETMWGHLCPSDQTSGLTLLRQSETCPHCGKFTAPNYNPKDQKDG